MTYVSRNKACPARASTHAQTLSARSTQVLRLAAVPLSTFFALMILLTGLSLALLAALLTGLIGITASGPPIGAWVVIALIPLLATAFWLHLRHRRALQLESEALLVLGLPLPSRFALADLDLEQARMLDLDADTDYRPSLYSSHNVNTPGLRHGHFRLRNGQRAFLAISHGPRVLWIPPARAVREHAPGLMLQPHCPDALLELLRSQASAHAAST